MRVSEIFRSIQGEGLRAGAVSVFLRLAGCNLRCRWCDTPYALEAAPGEQMSLAQVLARVKAAGLGEVVVTGGEPLLQPQTPALLEALTRAGRQVTVETNATRYVPLRCDLLSLSPKLANSTPRQGRWAPYAKSHDRTRLNLPAIQRFLDRHEYQLKFVVADERDVQEVERLLRRLRRVDRRRVLLMPQARTRQQYRRLAPWVAQQCLEHGVRFGPRLQIELWGWRPGR